MMIYIIIRSNKEFNEYFVTPNSIKCINIDHSRSPTRVKTCYYHSKLNSKYDSPSKFHNMIKTSTLSHFPLIFNHLINQENKISTHIIHTNQFFYYIFIINLTLISPRNKIPRNHQTNNIFFHPPNSNKNLLHVSIILN